MIYTSYFSSRKYSVSSAVSISRSTPQSLLKDGLVEYKKLAPTFDLLMKYKSMIKAGDVEEAEKMYVVEFEKILAKLDPQDVYNDLNEKVLLCYEKPSDFCHRHLVAEWLIDNGYDVREL